MIIDEAEREREREREREVDVFSLRCLYCAICGIYACPRIVIFIVEMRRQCRFAARSQKMFHTKTAAGGHKGSSFRVPSFLAPFWYVDVLLRSAWMYLHLFDYLKKRRITSPFSPLVPSSPLRKSLSSERERFGEQSLVGVETWNKVE